MSTGHPPCRHRSGARGGAAFGTSRYDLGPTMTLAVSPSTSTTSTAPFITGNPGPDSRRHLRLHPLWLSPGARGRRGRCRALTMAAGNFDYQASRLPQAWLHTVHLVFFHASHQEARPRYLITSSYLLVLLLSVLSIRTVGPLRNAMIKQAFFFWISTPGLETRPRPVISQNRAHVRHRLANSRSYQSRSPRPRIDRPCSKRVCSAILVPYMHIIHIAALWATFLSPSHCQLSARDAVLEHVSGTVYW